MRNLAIACLLSLAACSTPGVAPLALSPNRLLQPDSSPIKHIVVIVQENRSFENIFAGFKGANAPTYGYMSDGTKVKLHAHGFVGLDLPHQYSTAILDYHNGKMDGFSASFPQKPTYPYAYLDHTDIAPYLTMAQQYVLADAMFSDELSGSYAAHMNLIAATGRLSPWLALVDQPSNAPWGCDAPKGTTTPTLSKTLKYTLHGPFPCFTHFTTMADTLDSKGVSWKYYTPSLTKNGGQWSEFSGIKQVRYGSDWSKVTSPPKTVLTDITSKKLPSFSWVIPNAIDSDHASEQSDTGPSWVAAIVNTIGTSQYWNTTAIIVLWDDWGGWYDNAPPTQIDWVGLGIRVPCIIISPYAKKSVIHTQYEFGSVLKFAEGTFGLQSLGFDDARSTSIYDSFDFSQKPRAFTKIPAKYPTSHFLNEPNYYAPPDDD